MSQRHSVTVSFSLVRYLNQMVPMRCVSLCILLCMVWWEEWSSFRDILGRALWYILHRYLCGYVVLILWCVNSFTVLYQRYKFLVFIIIIKFCLYYLTLFLYFLSLISFTNIFWFISSSCVVIFVCSCLFGVFSFSWVPVCFTFLSSFACYRSFFICPSSLISHPYFIVLFGFRWGIPILSLPSIAFA